MNPHQGPWLNKIQNVSYTLDICSKNLAKQFETNEPLKLQLSIEFKNQDFLKFEW